MSLPEKSSRSRFPASGALVLLAILAAALPATAVVTPAAAPGPGAASASGAEAAYQFALAKMLMEEGDYRQAESAFERSLELDPAASYVRLEYAEFLTRLGRFGRDRDARLGRLQEAVAQAERAQRELSGNADGLRVLAEANLALAAEQPANPEPMASAVAALEALRKAEPGDVRSLLQLGQIYLRRGEPEAAAEVFQEVVRETPGYRPVYRMLAEALIQSGQMDKAGEALREVLHTEPDSESARLALAEILAERGAHREAAEVLRGAPTPLEAVEARTRLATELYLAGDLDAALAELDRLLADVPDSRYVRLLRGLVLSAQARNEEALAALAPMVGEGPGEADLAVTVSQLLLRQERDDEAVELLEKTVRNLEEEGPEGEARDARLALAQLYADLGRWAEVQDAVQPLLTAGPDEERRLDARLLAADALVEQGRGDEALALLEPPAAPEAPPSPADQARIEAKRAELLAKTGREREAVAMLSRAAGAGEPAAFLEITEGLHRAGRFEETIVPLQDFLGETPGSTAGRFLLGAAQERAGNRPDAESTFTGLLAEQPDFHPALNYLGYMWIEEGQNLERAMDLVQKAVELDPDNGAYIDSLGWGYYQLGRFDEAREALERAARLIQDSTVYEHLGDVYAALGEEDSARRAYRRAMTLEADDPEAVAKKLGALDGRAGEDAPDLRQP
ncbi:MAG TPA: tetratricopeptide repeat protein [Thermoanaerobaculia bacterium]